MRLLRRGIPVGVSVGLGGLVAVCDAAVPLLWWSKWSGELCGDGWHLQDNSADCCCSELFGELAHSWSFHMSVRGSYIRMAGSHFPSGSPPFGL